MTSKQTVLITGCSPGGIGHALALQFHRHPSKRYHVIATARNVSSLTTLSSLGITILALTVDSESSIQSLLPKIQHICSTTGDDGLHYLINNAGVNLTLPALDIDMADARQCFETNFFAVVRLTQVFAPLLISGQGTIVMLGSLGSEMPYVFGSVYNASKAAVLAYADTLRVEMAPLGVHVVTIITGGVRSQLTKKVQRYLPENSYYKALEGQFEKRKTHSADVGMDVEEYAAKVMGQLISPEKTSSIARFMPWKWIMGGIGRKRWIWAGSGSTLVWLLSGGWLRNGLFDWYFTKKFQLNLLREKRKTA